MNDDLIVFGAGVCCAIGQTTQAVSCALRAGIDNFMESDFISENGSIIKTSKVQNIYSSEINQLINMSKIAIREAIENINITKDVDIILMTPTLSRESSSNIDYKELFKKLQSHLSFNFGENSKIIPGGRGDLHKGISYAREILSKNKTGIILLLGVDSYLNSSDIMNYVSQDRILTDENSDGFIPGEAASVIVLKLPSQKNTYEKYFSIRGIGYGNEKSTIGGKIPNRSQGMTDAIRMALHESNMSMEDIDFRVSDQNGESFYAKDISNAITRCSLGGTKIPNILTIADCVGEIGAACGPLIISWLYRYMEHKDSPGSRGLVHLASDDGQRTAIVIEHS